MHNGNNLPNRGDLRRTRILKNCKRDRFCLNFHRQISKPSLLER